MAKSSRSEMCDKLIHQLITPDSMMKKCITWGSTNTIQGRIHQYGQSVSTGPLFGAPKLSCTHFYRQHHLQTGWQLCVQLSSFKIDPKLAVNRVKASLPDNLHYPKQFAFPKQTFREAQFLTICIALSHRSGTYGQCKIMPSLDLQALSSQCAMNQTTLNYG